jgi:hypothetical protein
MRVISKKRDFYDTAGYIDPTVVFVREEKEVYADLTYPHYSTGSHSGLLGFCGKFYPYIHRKVDAYTDTKTLKYHPEENYYYYSIDAYKESKFWNEYRRRSYYSDESAHVYNDFFNHWKDNDDIFVELDVPYFRVINFSSYYRQESKAKLLLNPILKDMQFGKVMNAPTVFQQVQFYLTNQLVKTKDPDDVDDKYRIAQHGFDSTSFRNPYRVSQLTKKKK